MKGYIDTDVDRTHLKVAAYPGHLSYVAIEKTRHVPESLHRIIVLGDSSVLTFDAISQSFMKAPRVDADSNQHFLIVYLGMGDFILQKDQLCLGVMSREKLPLTLVSCDNTLRRLVFNIDGAYPQNSRPSPFLPWLNPFR